MIYKEAILNIHPSREYYAYLSDELVGERAIIKHLKKCFTDDQAVVDSFREDFEG
jgi:predicted transcriptional regulator